MSQAESPIRVLRERHVTDRINMHRASMWRSIKAGTFPAPIRLGGNSVGWLESEIDAWLDERIAERTTPREKPHLARARQARMEARVEPRDSHAS